MRVAVSNGVLMMVGPVPSTSGSPLARDICRPPPMTSIRSICTILLTSSLAFGCASSTTERTNGPAVERGGGDDDDGPEKSPAKTLDEAKEKKVEAAQELSYAEAELEIAKFAQEAGEIEIAESLRNARMELDLAEEALARFNEVERPIELQEAKLELDDARNRLERAETDLAGLEDIFEEEAEAMAKPEILRRGRYSVARAKESLAVQQAKHGLAVDRELPAKVKKLAGEVRAAEAALRAAELAASERRKKLELELEKAVDQADAKKRAAEKAKKKVEELEAEEKES